MFLQSAQQIQPSFTVGGQAQAIATICRQVEGMPLALELAASWVRVLRCDEIVQQIQSNFDFLTTQLRNLPERHRSMRALADAALVTVQADLEPAAFAEAFAAGQQLSIAEVFATGLTLSSPHGS